jgi:predicted dehydrogenase
MSSPVAIALVGMGWWGKKMLSVLQAAPHDIRVVRAVEPNADSVRALCDAKGIALSSDYADALNDPAVEAVVLATPHAMHGEQIEAAVAAGKHVFCEKPLALTRAGAEKAVRLCAEADLVLGMGHERRFEPPMADLIARADSGALGRIHQIEANFSHDKFLALDRDNWRLKADQAPAGGMTATGIHLLDLSVRLLGPAASVLCICEQLSSDLPQGDTVAAYAKFRGGLARQPVHVALHGLRFEGLDRHKRQGACRIPRRLDRHDRDGRRPDRHHGGSARRTGEGQSRRFCPRRARGRCLPDHGRTSRRHHRVARGGVRVGPERQDRNRGLTA